jgi:hypothetical protein
VPPSSLLPRRILGMNLFGCGLAALCLRGEARLSDLAPQS